MHCSHSVMIRLSRSINTIFANNTNDWYVEGSHVVTHSLFDGSFPFGVTGNNNITGDPQFVDAANDDYRLQSTSSAINVGDNTVSGLPNEDLDGNPRVSIVPSILVLMNTVMPRSMIAQWPGHRQ